MIIVPKSYFPTGKGSLFVLGLYENKYYSNLSPL